MEDIFANIQIGVISQILGVFLRVFLHRISKM